MAVVGDLELGPVVRIVGQVISTQIHRDVAGVVELEPVIEIPVRRVGDEVGVRGHPLVDEHIHAAGFVGAARGHGLENFAREGLAIGEISVGQVGTETVVSEVIGDLRGRVRDAHQGHRAGGRVQPEVGVQIRARGFIRLAVRPDDEELAGRDRLARRERPLGQVGVVIVRQVVAIEADDIRAAVVEFDPGIAVTHVVLDAGDVRGLKLIQPERVIRRKRARDRVRNPRCAQQRSV